MNNQELNFDLFFINIIIIKKIISISIKIIIKQKSEF